MQTNDIQVQSETHFRSLVTVWFIFIISQVLFFIFALVVSPNADSFMSILRWPAVLFGLILFVDSFRWKRRLLLKAAQERNPTEVTRAYIYALSLSEATALFGFLLRFATFRYYYVLFALGAIATVFHFPRRQSVQASDQVL